MRECHKRSHYSFFMVDVIGMAGWMLNFTQLNRFLSLSLSWLILNIIKSFRRSIKFRWDDFISDIRGRQQQLDTNYFKYVDCIAQHILYSRPSIHLSKQMYWPWIDWSLLFIIHQEFKYNFCAKWCTYLINIECRRLHDILRKGLTQRPKTTESTILFTPSEQFHFLEDKSSSNNKNSIDSSISLTN